jgi:toxin secretion/phage lysis holin
MEAVIKAINNNMKYMDCINWEIFLLWAYLGVVDITSGTVSAISKREFTKKMMVAGIIKKSFELIVVATAILLGRLVELQGWKIPVFSFVCLAMCFRECGSILENASKMGVVPDSVKQMFDRVMNRRDGDNG